MDLRSTAALVGLVLTLWACATPHPPVTVEWPLPPRAAGWGYGTSGDWAGPWVGRARFMDGRTGTWQEERPVRLQMEFERPAGSAP